MRKVAAVGLVAMGVWALAEVGAADYQAEASLQRAVPASTDTEIDGMSWRCTADKCVGTPIGRASAGSRVAECRKLAAAVGKLASFASRGKELSKRDLDNCNRVAR